MKHLVMRIAATLAVVVGIGMSATPAMAAPMQSPAYAALGDSVAAGFGLPPSSNNPADMACGRSAQAYPYAVAAALNMQLRHVACSSATTDHGIYGSQSLSPTVALPPQITQAFADGAPKLMSITIGANDVHWNQVLAKCYTQGCGSAADSQQLAVLMLQLRLQLTIALLDIRLQSNGMPPTVFLTGYYAPVSNAQPVCGDTLGLTPTEITWIRHERTELDNTIRAAAAPFGFAHYAPIYFGGHELCSAEPWVQGLQSAGPFHPTAAGQRAMANDLLSAFHHGL